MFCLLKADCYDIAQYSPSRTACATSTLFTQWYDHFAPCWYKFTLDALFSRLVYDHLWPTTSIHSVFIVCNLNQFYTGHESPLAPGGMAWIGLGNPRVMDYSWFCVYCGSQGHFSFRQSPSFISVGLYSWFVFWFSMFNEFMIKTAGL